MLNRKSNIEIQKKIRKGLLEMVEDMLEKKFITLDEYRAIINRADE